MQVIWETQLAKPISQIQRIKVPSLLCGSMTALWQSIAGSGSVSLKWLNQEVLPHTVRPDVHHWELFFMPNSSTKIKHSHTHIHTHTKRGRLPASQHERPSRRKCSLCFWWMKVPYREREREREIVHIFANAWHISVDKTSHVTTAKMAQLWVYCSFLSIFLHQLGSLDRWSNIATYYLLIIERSRAFTLGSSLWTRQTWADEIRGKKRSTKKINK